MLSYRTVEPHTLELLKELTNHPLNSEMRLVGGTALALQYGHRKSVDLDFFGTFKGDIIDYSLSELLEFYRQKYPEHSFFRALMSLTYFDDAEQQPMPVMLNDIAWEEIKQTICTEVKEYTCK